MSQKEFILERFREASQSTAVSTSELPHEEPKHRPIEDINQELPVYESLSDQKNTILSRFREASAVSRTIQPPTETEPKNPHN